MIFSEKNPCLKHLMLRRLANTATSHVKVYNHRQLVILNSSLALPSPVAISVCTLVHICCWLYICISCDRTAIRCPIPTFHITSTQSSKSIILKQSFLIYCTGTGRQTGRQRGSKAIIRENKNKQKCRHRQFSCPFPFSCTLFSSSWHC